MAAARRASADGGTGSASERIHKGRTTIAALAERELREMVLGGRFEAGERLNEVALADSLGISRGPLREAVSRLAAEGLLTVVTHKGAYVRTVSPSDLRDLYELRIAVETYAVRLGVERASDEQLAGLDADLARTRAILERRSDEPYPADLDFHARVVSLARNEALLTQVRETHARLHLARARSAHDPRRARAAYDEHAAVVARVLARDAAGAAELMESHLRAALENAAQRLQAPAP
ncbi:GntR family transcriptional regulator [Nocardioides sp. SOB77]|uniref:GntR family transcriptional regulator n=1 Tax=Nocardioides oceani TaxID=3058369 RepID=A0ABT8FAJ3_9ACTN|nr:GntR family transcriptional regulator [Nocardioides oceani]MDN4171708.1 GntR family transcriptional regulator [Nocardioides oceani]